MIVDLERNDLSRVCEPGSVRWPELMVTRALAGVEHMVSTVEGRLRDGVGLAELLAATFPGGSITGRPEDRGRRPDRRDRARRARRVDGRAGSRLRQRRPRSRADDPDVRDRGGADPPLGRRRRRLGLGSAAEIAESWVKADPLLRAIGAPRGRARRAVAQRAIERGRSPMSADVGLLAVAVSGRGLVDPGEPVLAPDDEGFTRGRAAFETMRVYDGRPFRLAEHLARLQGSAERIGLERPDADEFEALAALALERAAGARGRAPALLVAGASRAASTARSCSSGRSRPGSTMPALEASDWSRCSIPAGRHRGCSRRRSRRAMPLRSRPNPRRRRAEQTTPCSSTPTPSCSKAR